MGRTGLEKDDMSQSGQLRWRPAPGGISPLRTLLLGIAVLVPLTAGVLPVLFLLTRSLRAGSGMDAYHLLLASSRQWMLMAHSLKLAALTALGSVVLGLPAGLLLSRTKLPGKHLLAGVVAMPLLLPPYLLSVGWMTVLSEGNPVFRLLGAEFRQSLTLMLFGLPGCVLVLTTTFMPLVVILVASGLRNIPPRLEEAGLMAASWPTVFFRISLPLVAPGLLLGTTLVFLLALGEVSVPSTFRYPVFAVESLSRFSASYDLDAAAAASMPLAGLTFFMLAAEGFLSRRTGSGTSNGISTAGVLRSVPLGRFRRTTILLVWGVGALLVGTPIASLAVQAGGSEAYLDALHIAADSLGHSLVLSVAGGTILAGIGFLLALFSLEFPGKPGKVMDAVTLFLFAVPGSVMGIALIVLWNRPWTNIVYTTPLMLLLGYLARYTAISFRLSRASMEMVHGNLLDAARLSGAGWGRRIGWILIPASWRGLATAWLAGTVFCLRDTDLTMLVHPPGWDTLPVRIMTLSANGDPRLIAALCLVLVGITVLPLMLLLMLPGGKEYLG